MQANTIGGHRGARRLMGVVALISAFAFTLPIARGAPAPDSNTVLILGSTIGFANPSLEKAKAMALGFNVEIASDVDWAAKSTADFATYRAIILGDATCPGVGTSPWLDAAEANRAIWTPAITGNVVVIGTDYTFHSSFAYAGPPGPDGDQVAESGIAFVTADPGTGALISLSCYYHGTAPGTPVPVLDQFGTFSFGGSNFSTAGVGCYNDAHIVAVHPALSGLTDASLSNWSCSVHEAFDGFPGNFLPLAIAENIAGAGSLSFADGSFGLPYIVARGETLAPILCGNGVLEAGEMCDDGNNVNGDGCSAACTVEIVATVCGDGAVASGEQCDPPTEPSCASLTYCSENCILTDRVMTCGDGCVDGAETCDDGNTDDGDECPGDCQNTAPDCSSASLYDCTPKMLGVTELWPPNHKFMCVKVSGVTDPDGDLVTVMVNQVSQDESVNDLGDGNTCPDAMLNGGDTVKLRSERTGTGSVGNGRVYQVGFVAFDEYGGQCTGTLSVCVPHDQSPDHVCVDDGVPYDSFVCPE